MALPPEPLDELLGAAAFVVEGKVLRVIHQDTQPSTPTLPPGTTGGSPMAAAQTVVIAVRRALKGSLPDEITAEKPQGAFVLAPGSTGAFFLAHGAPHFVIMGRYGPDTHAIERVLAALGTDP